MVGVNTYSNGVSSMALNGWPFSPTTDYGSTERNFRSLGGTGERAAIIMPRQKWTWIAEFEINPIVFSNSLTNLQQYLQNGKLYVNLKSIDIPKITFKQEKLRQYNQDRILLTKAEYPTCAMSMYDDSTSMVAALIKEYVNFYHETGDIGADIVDGSTWAQEDEKYNAPEILGQSVYFGTPNVQNRLQDDVRQSLGMRLRGSTNRNFFYNITVYDYGSDPDSINVYYYNRPVFTSIDHDQLDWDDRGGRMAVNFQLEYEGFYSVIGQPRSGGPLNALVGINPNSDAGPYPSTSHIVMNDSGATGVPSNIVTDNSGQDLGLPWLTQSSDPNAATARQPGESLDSYNQRIAGLDPSAVNYNLPWATGPSQPTGAQATALAQAQAQSDPYSTAYAPQAGTTLPDSVGTTARSASSTISTSDLPTYPVPPGDDPLATNSAFTNTQLYLGGSYL